MNARPGPAHPTRLLQSTHRSLELTWRGTDLEGKKRHRFAWICTNDLVKAFGEFGNLRRGSSTRALHGGRSRPTLLPSRSLTARVCLDGRTECPMDSGHDRRSSLREVLLDQAFDLLAQLLDARRRHVDGVTRHSCSLNPSPERLPRMHANSGGGEYWRPTRADIGVRVQVGEPSVSSRSGEGLSEQEWRVTPST